MELSALVHDRGKEQAYNEEEQHQLRILKQYISIGVTEGCFHEEL